MIHNAIDSIARILPDWQVRFILIAALFAICVSDLPTTAVAADVKQSTAINCVVSDGSGVVRQNHRSKAKRGSYSGTTALSDTLEIEPRFSRWVFSGEGLDLQDRIDLYWDLSDKPRATLRVAIDGPVSKPAQLLSITDDTVSAVVLTSDSDTTRTWLFTINFRQERVMSSGMASNIGGIKGQMIDLTCDFLDQSNTAALSTAADSWRRTDIAD